MIQSNKLTDYLGRVPTSRVDGTPGWAYILELNGSRIYFIDNGDMRVEVGGHLVLTHKKMFENCTEEFIREEVVGPVYLSNSDSCDSCSCSRSRSDSCEVSIS